MLALNCSLCLLLPYRMRRWIWWKNIAGGHSQEVSHELHTVSHIVERFLSFWISFFCLLHTTITCYTYLVPTHMLYLPFSQKVIFVQIQTSAPFVDLIYDARQSAGYINTMNLNFMPWNFNSWINSDLFVWKHNSNQVFTGFPVYDKVSINGFLFFKPSLVQSKSTHVNVNQSFSIQ